MQVIAKAMAEPSGASPEGRKAPFSPSAAAALAVKKRSRMMQAVFVSSQAPPPPPPPPLNPGGDDAEPSRTEDEESSSSEDLSESGDERCANLQLPKKPRRPKSAYRFFFLRERRRILREFAEERERRRRDREDDGSGSHEGDDREATTGQHEQIGSDIVRLSKRTLSPRFGFGETSNSAFGHVVGSNPDPDSDFFQRGGDSSKTDENLSDEGPCCEPDEDEIVRIIGERWKAVASEDPQRLARCQRMAEREMDRYKMALKEYSQAVACIGKESKPDPQGAKESVVASKLPCHKSMQKRPRKIFETCGGPGEPATLSGGRRLIDGRPMPRRVVNMAPPASPARPSVQRLGSRSSLSQHPPVLRHLPGAPSRFGNGARTPSSSSSGRSPLQHPPLRSLYSTRRATSVPPMSIPPRPRVEKNESAADVSLPLIPGLSSTSQAA